jgi:hypothetical protein
MVIMPETDINDAENIAERIRKMSKTVYSNIQLR